MAHQRTMRGWIWILLILLLAGGGFAAWAYYKRKPQNDKIEYRTAEVTEGDVIQLVSASGYINPVVNVEVGSQVSGIIKEIYVDFNSVVTNGQVIAQIDPSTVEQFLLQAEAELAISKASLELARLNFNRAKDLLNNKLIAPAEHDTAYADFHQAEAQVKVREAALRKAKVDLERCTIYAPIDGVVISRNVDIGQTVAASFNTPKLFQIANDLSKMWIEALVSEADVGGIEVGQPVTFRVDAFIDRVFKGEVKQVRYAPITNQNVVSYATIVDVDNSDLKLRPGMTATVSIITGQRNGVLRVPNAALRFRPPELPSAGGTNRPGLAGGSGRFTGGPGGPGSSGRGPGMGGPGGSQGPSGDRLSGRGPGGGGPSPEMRERFANLSPEQREQFRSRFRGGPPGAEQPTNTRTVYVLEKGADPQKPTLRPVQAKVGLSDGTNTEIIEGLKPGELVVTGASLPQSATAAARPFGGSPFGGGFRPR